MNHHRIPKIDSIQELAQFWDTHDLTDFEDQLEEVKEPIFERKTVMQILLQPEEAKAVKALARSRGIPYTDLIHEWVVERIQASGLSS